MPNSTIDGVSCTVFGSPVMPGISSIRPFQLLAAGVLAAAKLAKTEDELACIREAQRINELAMHDVIALLRPGVRQSDLTAVNQLVFDSAGNMYLIGSITDSSGHQVAVVRKLSPTGHDVMDD